MLSEISQSQRKKKKELTHSQEEGGRGVTCVCLTPKKALNHHVLLVSQCTLSAYLSGIPCWWFSPGATHETPLGLNSGHTPQQSSQNLWRWDQAVPIF